ncbi:MAG: segregation/condensation protein A, partial [Eubacteriales bacterium]
VRAQSKKILNLLKANKELRFIELFEEEATAMEIAVTFLAMLQLWHTDKLMIDQKSSFGDILVKAA